jgi:hypothetical protein
MPFLPAPERDSVAVVDSRFTSKEADVASKGADREGTRDTVLLEKRLQTLRNLRSGRGGGGGGGRRRRREEEAEKKEEEEEEEEDSSVGEHLWMSLWMI